MVAGLQLVMAAYVSVQGALVLNALVDPATTLAGHALALPVAIAVLAMAWRPLVAGAR